MSRGFLDRAQRVHASDDSDSATAQTVRLMCGMVNQSVSSPLVQRAAQLAVDRYKGGPYYQGDSQRDPRAAANSAWWFAHSNIEFMHHDPMIAAMWGEVGQQQLLIYPDVLLSMARPAGDCAVFTTLICALLKCRGVRFEIETIECDPGRPGEYSHIFCRAVMPDGQRITLDASHGKYPGWRVPAAHTGRVQVWDESGNPIADAQPWKGLHGYRRRGVGDTCYDPETGDPIYCAPSTDSAPGNYLNTFGIGPSGSTAPSNSNWTSFIQSLSSQALNLVGRITAPTTTVQRGPNGQLLISTPNSQLTAATAAGTPLFNASVGGGGSTWLWVGGGVVGLILLSKMFGGKR